MSDQRDITNQAQSDTGFTLVETIVALVLSLIVGGIVTGIVVNIFTSGSRSSNRYQAQRLANQAIDQLTDDLGATRAPGRESDKIQSLDMLRDEIWFAAGGGPDVHDVKKATGTQLVIVADYDRTNAGSECVKWSFTPDGKELHRTVSKYVATPTAVAGADPAPMAYCPETDVYSKTTVMRNLDNRIVRWWDPGASGNSNPFKYRLLATSGTEDDPSCTSTAYLEGAVNLTATQLDQITNISFTLAPVFASNDDAGEMKLNGTMGIKSRQNYEYKYALGCTS